MDHGRLQDSQSAVLCYGGEVIDEWPTKRDVSPSWDVKRPIRRVRSPSRPRAWLSSSYKPKFAGGISRSRHHGPRRELHHFQPKIYYDKLRKHSQENDRVEDAHVWKESSDESPKTSLTNSSRPHSSRSTSSRDKDTQFAAGQGDRNQSRESDHKGGESKEREQSRDSREPPSTVSQTTARYRAIQQKRKEIEEVYYQDCQMFGLVTKMLIAKDASLEEPIQSALQENLRDIGRRCLETMERFIKDYDSKELPHTSD